MVWEQSEIFVRRTAAKLLRRFSSSTGGGSESKHGRVKELKERLSYGPGLGDFIRSGVSTGPLPNGACAPQIGHNASGR